MNKSDERIINKQGYRLHMIQTDKFKTINIAAKYSAPLDRETITKRALLPFVIQQGSDQYPTSVSFRQALDELYGASFNIDGSKKGEMHLLTARLSLANPAYLATDEPVLTKALDFFKGALYAPKVVNGGFDPHTLAREKQSLKQKIDSIIDNKMHYANMRMIDQMCADEPYHLHGHGYPEDFSTITAEDLYCYYKDVVEHNPLDIYVVGDLEELEIERLIDERFSRDTNNTLTVSRAQHQNVKQPNEIIERQDIQQGKLHFGFRTYTTMNDNDYFALQLFNAIFGGFPSSKLFINVREKNSLAYYAASRFESHKGLLFVFSGIAPEDYLQAKTIILDQFEAMKKGDFTGEQIAEAKLLLINQYKEALDDADGLIEVNFNRFMAGEAALAIDYIDAIKTVSYQEITEMANKLKLDTSYFLTREEK